MTTLVTGASGFLGRRVVASLRAAGVEVVGVDRRAAPDVRVVDLDDTAATEGLLDDVRPRAIVHVAWYAEHGKFWSSTENLRSLGASVRLLESALRRGVQRFVGVGTCAELDWRVPVERLREDAPCAPATLYGVTKDAFRRTLEATARTAGISWAWPRVFFLYAEDEAPGRLFAHVAGALARGEPAETTEGTQVRDFLHADDVGAAIAAVATSAVVGPVHVGSGEPRTLAEIVRAIGAAAGRPELVRLGARPMPAGEAPRIVADVARLRDEVGFVPTVSLEAGIARVVGGKCP